MFFTGWRCWPAICSAFEKRLLSSSQWHKACFAKNCNRGNGFESKTEIVDSLFCNWLMLIAIFFSSCLNEFSKYTEAVRKKTSPILCHPRDHPPPSPNVHTLMNVSGFMLGRAKHEKVSVVDDFISQHRVWSWRSYQRVYGHNEYCEESKFRAAVVLFPSRKLYLAFARIKYLHAFLLIKGRMLRSFRDIFFLTLKNNYLFVELCLKGMLCSLMEFANLWCYGFKIGNDIWPLRGQIGLFPQILS